MRRFGGRLVVGVLALVTLVAVGAYTYGLGVARGLMETGRAVESTGAGVPIVHLWHPWGFGFFPFFPLVFILFWVFVLRGLFWRGPWRRRYWHDDGMRAAFEEWHRRAHASPERGSAEP
jgi:hypothetical protein